MDTEHRAIKWGPLGLLLILVIAFVAQAASSPVPIAQDRNATQIPSLATGPGAIASGSSLATGDLVAAGSAAAGAPLAASSNDR